jgi:hypothetical protein
MDDFWRFVCKEIIKLNLNYPLQEHTDIYKATVFSKPVLNKIIMLELLLAFMETVLQMDWKRFPVEYIPKNCHIITIKLRFLIG